MDGQNRRLVVFFRRPFSAAWFELFFAVYADRRLLQLSLWGRSEGNVREM